MAPGGSLGAALLAWGRCLVLGLGLALGARLREQQSLGAVMVLVSRPWDKPRGNRRCFFNTSMASLATHWYPWNPYPVYLLSVGKWSRTEKTTIRRTWPLDFHFIDITRVFDDAFPPGLQLADNGTLGTLAYKKMVSFKLKGFTLLPELKSYRYIMNLDDDSCLLDPIRYDMFQEMRSVGSFYAYPHIFLDKPNVIVGLKDFVESYMTENRLAWANPALRNLTLAWNKTALAFYGNLDIIDTVRWQKADIQDFVGAVIASNNIWHRRWSDSPIKYWMAQMFWTKDQVSHYCDFDFQHSSWQLLTMCNSRTNVDAVLKSLRGFWDDCSHHC